MVFESLTANAFHHIPCLGDSGGPSNVYFTDIFSTYKNTANPLTGSMFLLETTANPEPAPKYGYDETGVLLQGDLTITDETGAVAKLQPGDIFFIRRGSLITFTTTRFALAYKTAARLGDCATDKAINSTL